MSADRFIWSKFVSRGVLFTVSPKYVSMDMLWVNMVDTSRDLVGIEDSTLRKICFKVFLKLEPTKQ